MQAGLKSLPSKPRQGCSPQASVLVSISAFLASPSGPSVASTKDFWEQLSVDTGLNCKIWLLSQQVRYVNTKL